MTPVRYPHVSPHHPHCRYHHNNIIITHHKRSLTSRWPVTASAPGDKSGEKWQRWPSVGCGVTQQNVQLGLSKVSGKAENVPSQQRPCCRYLLPLLRRSLNSLQSPVVTVMILHPSLVSGLGYQQRL